MKKLLYFLRQTVDTIVQQKDKLKEYVQRQIFPRADNLTSGKIYISFSFLRINIWYDLSVNNCLKPEIKVQNFKFDGQELGHLDPSFAQILDLGLHSIIQPGEEAMPWLIRKQVIDDRQAKSTSIYFNAPDQQAIPNVNNKFLLNNHKSVQKK